MEKIVRDMSNPKLQPILDNWLIWGNEWKYSKSDEFPWIKKLPGGKSYDLKEEALIDLLEKLTGNRCAFCDYYPIINAAYFFSIEHFYPKDQKNIYAIYAYQWENLFPVCQKCNNIKRNSFSLLLLKPDENNYKFDSYFSVSGNGKIEPNPNKDSHNQNRASETIKLYGLNRSELVENRRKKVKEFEDLCELLRDTEYKVRDIRPLNKEPYHFFIERSLNIDNYKNFDDLWSEINPETL